MLSALALFVLTGQTRLPLWTVAEFRDLKGGPYGFAAAREIAGRLSDAKAYEIVSGEAVRQAAEKLGIAASPKNLVDLSRLGVEVLGSVDPDVLGGAVVQGEVLDYRVEKGPRGKRARLGLRVVVYDLATMLPVNGALEIGASPFHRERATDGDLLGEALEKAAQAAAEALRGRKTPTATVVSAGSRSAITDGGTREGFASGDLVFWSRGPTLIGTVRLGRVWPDGADFVVEGRIGGGGIMPGAKVRQVFTPPPLPAKGESVLGKAGR